MSLPLGTARGLGGWGLQAWPPIPRPGPPSARPPASERGVPSASWRRWAAAPAGPPSQLPASGLPACGCLESPLWREGGRWSGGELRPGGALGYLPSPSPQWGRGDSGWATRAAGVKGPGYVGWGRESQTLGVRTPSSLRRGASLLTRRPTFPQFLARRLLEYE